MSGRILDFKSYIGGADNVITQEMTPSTQKTFNYDYGQSVSAYTFAADMQTIVVDTLAYDRVTGDPNFADSSVVGYFANAEIGSGNIGTGQASSGIISLTIPSDRYTGPITPDARTNVAITVAAFKWTDGAASPTTTDSHRWAIIERYEPDVSPGNPRLVSGFTPLGVGAIATFSNDGSTDASRVEGNYPNVTGLAGGDSEGSGASFAVYVDSSGNATINLVSKGSSYVVGDTIKLLDASMGGGGAADITVTVSTIA